MADSLDVMKKITRRHNVIYSVLTPNVQGFEKALEAGATQVAIFTSSSEGFCQHNINCSIADSLTRFEPVMELAAKHNIPVRGYLSCVADCPYDGPTKPEQVARVANLLMELGCYEVSLGDTIGTGTPIRIAKMLEAVQVKVPTNKACGAFSRHMGTSVGEYLPSLNNGHQYHR